MAAALKHICQSSGCFETHLSPLPGVTGPPWFTLAPRADTWVDGELTRLPSRLYPVTETRTFEATGTGGPALNHPGPISNAPSPAKTGPKPGSGVGGCPFSQETTKFGSWKFPADTTGPFPALDSHPTCRAGVPNPLVSCGAVTGHSERHGPPMRNPELVSWTSCLHPPHAIFPGHENLELHLP